MVIPYLRINIYLVLRICFVDRCLSLVLFHLSIVVSVLFRFTNYDYNSGIFKLLFQHYFLVSSYCFISLLIDVLFWVFSIMHHAWSLVIDSPPHRIRHTENQVYPYRSRYVKLLYQSVHTHIWNKKHAKESHLISHS